MRAVTSRIGASTEPNRRAVRNLTKSSSSRESSSDIRSRLRRYGVCFAPPCSRDVTRTASALPCAVTICPDRASSMGPPRRTSRALFVAAAAVAVASAFASAFALAFASAFASAFVVAFAFASAALFGFRLGFRPPRLGGGRCVGFPARGAGVPTRSWRRGGREAADLRRPTRRGDARGPRTPRTTTRPTAVASTRSRGSRRASRRRSGVGA